MTPTTSPGSSSPSVDAQHLPPGSPRRPSEAGRTMSFAVPHNPDRRSMATQEIPYLQAQMNSATRNRNPDLGWDQTSQVQRSPPQQQSSPPLGLGAHLTRRASRAMSIMSRSSTSSVAQSTMSGNIVRVDTSGTLGCIIDSPDPSRLILFLKGRTQFDTHALLVIDSKALQVLFDNSFGTDNIISIFTSHQRSHHQSGPLRLPARRFLLYDSIYMHHGGPARKKSCRHPCQGNYHTAFSPTNQ